METNIGNISGPEQPSETIVFSGKIGEVIHTKQPDGRVFEKYRRPPGTRLIIISPAGKILITKEHRHESGSLDLRLPGGKVCDSLKDFQALLGSQRDMTEAAADGAKKEAREETGLVIEDPELITIAKSGATVDWDLYYFRVHNYSKHPKGQALEHGEDIEVTWMSTNEIRQAITDGQMQEWRSVGVLLGKVFPELEANGIFDTI